MEKAGKVRFFTNYYDRAGTNVVKNAAVVVGGTKTSLTLLSGTTTAGTYSVDLPAGSGCQEYYFEGERDRDIERERETERERPKEGETAHT